MFNTDKPISSSKDDVLGRKIYARTLGKAIINDANKDSHVIAFYGKWGSGKTSFINMVLEYIEDETKDVENDKKPIIIKFNPWNYSNQNQLITQFFNQLSNALDKEDNSRWLKKGAKLLRTYSKIISPLSSVPGFGTFAFATSTASEMVGETAENIASSLETDLEGTKNEIIELLNKTEQRIIIVIDDIDRLNETEIRQTFQLVKSLADFPNTIYFLTFDREIVSKALESEQNGYGEQYLEKIVQIPFELPEFSRLGFESLLFSKLDVLIQNNPHDDFDRVYWGNLYRSGFKHFFKNIRDINRYINILNFNYETIKEEVYILDFIAITAIQVFLPDVYNGIKNNKNVFAGIMPDAQKKDIEKEICDEIIKNSDKDAQKFLQPFLTVLFPRITSLYRNHHHGVSSLESWRKSRRICSTDFFDVYFRFSLPEGKISQAEIKMLLSYGTNVAKISELLLQFNKENKISDFLTTFTDYTKDISNEHVESFVTAIMDIGDCFPDDDSTFYGTPLKIHWITSSLLKQIDSQEERFNILKRSIINTNRSLYTIVWEIDIQDELHRKYNYEESQIPEDEQLINSEQLQHLEQLTCDKIKRWAENENIINSTHLYAILKLWEKWDSGNKHQDYIDSIVSNNVALSNLITSMISKKISQSITNYVPEITWKIDIDILKEIAELDYIKTRLIQIKESSDYDNLTKNQKVGIDICLEEIGKQKHTQAQSTINSA